MTTEARDALAMALETADADGFPIPGRHFTDYSLAILAALPDGWVLARREDAEDGAALSALSFLYSKAEFACCNRAAHKVAHHHACPVAKALGLPRRGVGEAAAARKATKALR